MTPEPVCRQCGGTFTRRLIGRTRVFCSAKCRNRWVYENKADIPKATIEYLFQQAKAKIAAERRART